MLVEFFKLFGHITKQNFVQINKIILNGIYYKIVHLTLRYEYSTTLIFHKTNVKLIRNYNLNRLFKIFNNFYLITPHNLVKINIITLNYAY
jgi:hypothetical protein